MTWKDYYIRGMAMSNGLSLSLSEFQSLPNAKKLDCLYENQVKTLGAIKGYRFNQKVQYSWLSALTLSAGFIIKFFSGKL